MRLVADLGKEQKVAGERLKEIEELTRDRDIAKQKVREAELELQQVKDSLKQSQEAWNETRERLTEQDIKLVFLWKRHCSRTIHFITKSAKIDYQSYHEIYFWPPLPSMIRVYLKLMTFLFQYSELKKICTFKDVIWAILS